MFWPGMKSQIEEIVSNCPACTEYQSSNPKEPMIAHKLPDRGWQNVATDLFELDNEHYLIVVDYYSGYFESERMPDNGPQFSAQEFVRFAKEWDFSLVTSSPRYPQSNSLAEKAVRTAEQLLKKARLEQRNPYVSLLEHSNAPVNSLATPAQLLMSRHLRSIPRAPPQTTRCPS